MHPLTFSHSHGCLLASPVPNCLLSGSFSDGHGYNSPYLRNQRCVWNIIRNNDPYQPVQLSFSFFALETGCDFLTITDYLNPSFVIARFTGAQIPTNVTFPNAISLEFVSDSMDYTGIRRPTISGFNATFDWTGGCQTDDACGGKDKGTCVSGQCVCADGRSGGRCEKEVCAGTRRIFVPAEGVTFSSGVSQAENNQDCRWQLVR